MLNNNQSSKNSISHRELLALMNKAKKEITPIDSSEFHENERKQEFDDLISKWTETSQEILLTLNKKEPFLTKNRNPKSLMAFGAMGAHINMAIQALKAAESDQ